MSSARNLRRVVVGLFGLLGLIAAGVWMSKVVRPAAGPVVREQTEQPVNKELRMVKKGQLQPGEGGGYKDLAFEEGEDGHQFEISLQAGSFLHVVVEQRGVDVEAILYRPDGKRRVGVDSPNGSEGPEIVFDVAEQTGFYRLDIVSADTVAPYGKYDVKVESIRLAEEKDHQHVEAWRTFRRGELERQDGEFRKALEKYEEALAVWEELNDAWQAESHFRIGWMQQELGEEELALASFQKALPLLKEQGRRIEEGTVLNRIGRCHYLLGEHSASLASSRQAHEIFQAANAQDLVASALNNLGNLSVARGEYQHALDLFHSALFLGRETGAAEEVGAAVFGIGDILVIQGKLDLALDHLREALEIFHQQKRKADEASALLRIANVEQRLGLLDESRADLERALELQVARGDRSGEARVRNSLGTIQLLSKQADAAAQNYQKALTLFREAGNRFEEAVALHNLARQAYETGDYRRAFDLHEQAAGRFLELGNRPRQVSALFGSSRALHLLGREEEANQRLERVLASLEDLREAADSVDLRTGFLASKQHYYSLHMDVLMRLHEKEPTKGYDARAIYVNESRRARGLLDLLSETGHTLRRGIDPALIGREENLQQSINALDLKILSQGGNTDQIAELEREQRNLLMALEDLRTKIGRQNPRFAALRKPEALTVPEIQEQVLGESSLLLIYALGDERSRLWLVPHRGGIRSYDLPSRSWIESIARQALQALRTRGEKARDGRWLSQLSEALLGPVAEELHDKRLVIVADGALEALPFAVLPDPRHAGPDPIPLIVKHEIVYLPSASVLATLRRDLADRLPAPRRLAVIADPVFGPDDPRMAGLVAAGEPSQSQHGLPSDELRSSARDLSIDGFERLPYTAEEAEAITKLLPEDQRFEAIGFQANRDIVLSGQLRRYRVLHFATHGLLNPRHPELSGLVLSLFNEKGHARDGFLRAYELSNLDLPAELAVLSACETGLGQEVRGEGVLGLARSFMYAGVPRVIMSLWNVSDRGTSVLMTHFYKGLFEMRLRPPEALRYAQLEMLGDMRFKDPFYWAPFVFQGEWRLEIRASDGGIEKRVGGSGAGTQSDDDLPPPLQRASWRKNTPM